MRPTLPALLVTCLAAVATACGAAPPPPAAPTRPVRFELQPVNHAGDPTATIRIPGRAGILVALAEKDGRTVVVRLLDGERCSLAPRGGAVHCQYHVAELFAVPGDGDVTIDGEPAVDGASRPGEFTLVSETTTREQIRTTTRWQFRWNAARNAFDIGRPATTTERIDVCEACDRA